MTAPKTPAPLTTSNRVRTWRPVGLHVTSAQPIGSRHHRGTLVGKIGRAGMFLLPISHEFGKSVDWLLTGEEKN